MTDNHLAKEAASSGHGTYTILIVDDETAILSGLRRCLRKPDYTILTAENGQVGLDLVAHNSIAVVISDYRMPGLSGTEFLAKVRELDPLPIRILLTGAAEASVVTAAIDSGVLHKYITKPWDDKDLQATVALAVTQFDLIRENKLLKQRAGEQHSEIKQLRSYLGSNTSPLGSALVAGGLILPAQLEMIRKYCTQHSTALFRAIVELGMVDEEQLLQIVQSRAKVDPVRLSPIDLPRDLAALLPRDVCEAGCLVPIGRDGTALVIAMADVLDLQRIDYVRFATSLNVKSRLASWTDIRAAIGCLYGGEDAASVTLPQIEDVQELVDIDIVLDETDTDPGVEGHGETQSAVKLVNWVFSRAIHLGASDIHIEPKGDHTEVRFRIDGLLQDGLRVPASLHPSTISRLKILANMDISIRRIPQDGRIGIRSGKRSIDVRISTLPTIYGEKAVCRLLDKNASVKSMVETGIAGESLHRLQRIIAVPQGIIIATGPTGSGKTTMLYSLLHERLSRTLNAVTIEDPVEYMVEDASQVHIKDKIGLTFASTLRCTLRQDPDIILVGEIRDLETAQAAFQAAMTGHLVFSTLHTTSSVGAITRLIHLGVQPYLVASSVQGIIAQRLVRRVCPNCGELSEYDHALPELLGWPADSFADKLILGRGCEQCGGTGFKGRTGLFEVFHMTDQFRRELIAAYDESRVTDMAVGMGMTTLREDARQKVRDGVTTLDEVLRVLGPSIEFGLRCPGCGAQVEPQFRNCPHCGSGVHPYCERCGGRLEEDWSACPNCGQHVVVKDMPRPDLALSSTL